MKHHMVSVVLL